MIEAMFVRGTVRETAGIVGPLVIVMALAVAALRGLDVLPRWVAGEGRGVVRYASVAGVEQVFGERLLMPAFFPATLQWPPAAVRFHAGPPPAVAVTFAARDGGAERLVLYETHGARASIPMALMPAGLVLHRVAVPVAQGEAVLYRVQMSDGAIRNDLVWHRDDAAVALRYAGPADELVTIAKSLRRGRP
jgi:hypothetical protein